ncbi:hypothetical protein [Streptomyces sp. NPDC001307]|uniref:hypothetical protein n=1 Tax=Streptomyces sp. NPDC001307 TaxID=3364560 RepID=UPI00369FD400
MSLRELLIDAWSWLNYKPSMADPTFAEVAICMLAARGETAPIPTVALLGGVVFARGTIVNVSIHIRSGAGTMRAPSPRQLECRG